MIDLSIIIVSYNTREFTQRCIESIYKNTTGIIFEIICVDNASIDDSADMVKREFPDVVLVESDDNLGYAKANNIGIRKSQGELIGLLNSDTVIQPNSLEKVVEFLRNNPNAGAASPKLLNPDGSVQYCIRTLPDIKTAFFQSLGWHKLFPGNRITDKYYHTNLDYNKVLSVDSVGTSCYVIKRSVVDQVGLLDEDFFMYNVDLDYNKRIKDAGLNIYYVPEAKVIHYGGISVNQNSYRGIFEQHQGMRLMYKKHYKADNNALVNFLIPLAIRFRLLIKLFIVLLTRDKRVINGHRSTKT